MSSSAIFDQSYYLSQNADVTLAISQGHFASALDHFSQFGGKELRAPNSSFNPNYYAINNADVLNAVSQGVFASVFVHYQSFGESENRAPNTNLASFDEASYLAANTDVAAAVTAGSFSSALDHFISFGQAEARTGSGVTEAANPGTSSSLTTGVDSVTGTTGSDTISGTTGNADPTIGAGDQIDGGAGTDTFAITVTGTTAATVAGVSLTNVETVRLSDTSTAATTINLAGQSGVTTISSFGSAHTGALASFTNVGTIAALSLSNTSSNGTYNIGYTSGATSGTNTQAITLDTAASTGDVTIDGIEVFNVSATGSSTLALDGNSATTVNVSASDATTIDLNAADNTNLTTVTGAGSAGAITFVMNPNLSDLSVTGGDGNDIIDTSSGAFGTSDTIDGGAGTGDTVRYIAAADTASAAIGATGATISNVEVLELQANDDAGAGSANDITADMDIADGVTSILLDSNDTEFASVFTLQDLSVAQAAAITVQSVSGTTNGTNIELDLKDGAGSADSASITAAVASGNVITVGDANGDIENLTVAMNGDVASALTLDASDFSTGTSASLTVTGGSAGRAMTITQTTSNVVADTVTMSGVASDISMTMGAANQTITTGSGDDTITFGTNYTSADTVDGGAGNDRIVIDPASTIATAGTVTNVEELEIGATATVSVNVASMAIPEVILQAQNGITNVVTLANASAVTDIGVSSGATNLDDFNGVTFSGTGFAGTSDAITITGNIADNAATTGAFNLAGIESININVTATGDADVFTVGNLVNNAVNTMTVTSTGFTATNTVQGVVLGSVGDGANGMSAFDASGADTGVSVTLADMSANSTVTGSGFRDLFVMTGSAAGSFVNSGAGNDTITSSGNGDTIDGEGGADTIKSVAGADTITGGAGNDTIEVRAAGADSITLGTGIDTLRIGTAVTNQTPDIQTITVTDFTAGAGGDVFDLGDANGDDGAIVAAYIAGVTSESGLTIDTSANGDVTVSTGLIIMAGQAAAAGLSVANAVTILNDRDGAGGTGGIMKLTINSDDFLVAISDGTNVGIFHIEGDTINTTVDAADVDLVATLNNVTIGNLVSANFADFV
jgi:hypothetical protein